MKLWVLVISSMSLVNSVLSGAVDNVNLDPKCVGGALHEFRLTDCTHFPCIIKRGKEYTIDADFSSSKDIVTPNVRCGTIYLGRQVPLSGYGGCHTLSNGTCPIQAETIYSTTTSFKIPYYVPSTIYTVWCRLEDDSGQTLVCGSGSGKVV
ncbi:NPC intracellular cholesterol transporter 2 [Folsomia candida]|uniref:Epididymal secretory protein E1 n=1 Tax=Folsomia candida TaxID=158441 RepID=A0A226E0K6_FOLCA|nr:NPC intracellular cholesterol transporter 2 [Folsomia candida]OXA50006.1 Epididymal secretory protein E1 [Folsomia candida]